MNSALHARAAELFSEACDLGRDEQTELLGRIRSENAELASLVAELLDEDRTPDERLERPAVHAAIPFRDGARDPETIGRYRIVGRLGEGGMGIVYEAEQDQPRRNVALKVLRRGFVTEESLRRFEHEAEVLGWLHHPGVAQVYEAGTADAGDGPQPFFAMELVRGETLTAYADARKLPARARLELLARVCDAVHHAHQKGVVHRDLKPSNVLVDASGQPKVLDFGVARVTGSDLQATSLRTDVGQLVGTLAYMSPEQVEGDPSRVDARSDVYALGVIAYELLAGRRPYEIDAARIHEAARVIVQQEPSGLGTVDRRLRGDVSTIVAKAIEKERDRRYGSAHELASDIRRHLAHEPIVARPASAVYQVRKFARRHTAVVVGAAGIFLTLAAGFAVSTRLYLQAEDARASEKVLRTKAEDASALEHDLRAKAEDSAAALRETNDYFLTLLRAPSPWTDGANVKVADVLDQSARKIEQAFPDRPAQRARLLDALATTYGGLGQWPKARGYFAQALELRRLHTPDEKSEIANLEREYGRALRELGALDEAETMAVASIADADAIESPGAAQVRATCRLGLASIRFSQERFDESEAEGRKAIALLEGMPGATAVKLAPARQIVAQALAARGRYADAEKVCRESLDALDAQS
ncbi:MAG TPA: serine/threonine-protein kinase, partial [Planctomycetota bacterium]|nr:serine/threonine-protein kinase [Planctomycetota bacterium]